MKTIVTASLMAIGALMLTQQQASAWTHNKFSMGLTYEHQAANNSCLWGAHRVGQIPAPSGYAPTPYPAWGYGNVPSISPPIPVGPGYPQSYAPVPHGGYDVPVFDSSFAGTSMNWGSPYQFANYPRPYYYYPNTWSYGR